MSELQPSNLDNEQRRIGIRAPVLVEPVVGEPEAYPPCPETGIKRLRKQQLVRPDFLEHGYTLGCSGCDVIRYGFPGEARHSAACRKRMGPLLQQTPDGARRLAKAANRQNQYFAAVLH